MITRIVVLLPIVALFPIALGAQPAPRDSSGRLDFNRLPGDDQICAWLMSVSPTFQDAYHAIVKRPDVEGIQFKSIPHKTTAFSEVGVFFVDNRFEIRISAELTGAERVRTLAFEVANAYLNEEHRQIDAGAAKGFLDAREYALAHEIYEYEAWRLYRRVLCDLEKELGEGNLPVGLFYGTAATRVAEYKLPPLFEYLKHMESSQHMKHYLDWFQKYYSQNRMPNNNAERLDALAPE
jgi:hypothetical protein